jgi:hypothetical protein
MTDRNISVNSFGEGCPNAHPVVDMYERASVPPVQSRT